MGRLLLTRQQPCPVQEKGPGTHGNDGFTILCLPGNKTNERRIVNFLARALTARNQEKIQFRASLKRYMGFNKKTFGAGYRMVGLRHDKPVFRAAEELAPHAYHFPWPDKIQFFNIRKNEKTEIHIMSALHNCGKMVRKRRIKCFSPWRD